MSRRAPPARRRRAQKHRPRGREGIAHIVERAAIVQAPSRRGGGFFIPYSLEKSSHRGFG